MLEQTDFDMIKEKLQDDIETASLLKLAGTRKNSATVSFESVIKEEGMTVEEVEALEAGDIGVTVKLKDVRTGNTLNGK